VEESREVAVADGRTRWETALSDCGEGACRASIVATMKLESAAVEALLASTGRSEEVCGGSKIDDGDEGRRFGLG
jgi:hypothetical protein